MLKVTDLQAGYEDSQVLFGMDLAVGKGEVLSLLGRNGMGKTTTISSIMGIIDLDDGDIQLEGRSLRGCSPYEIARLGLGLVPEGRQIFPNLTVRENLIATASNRGQSAPRWTVDTVLELFPMLRPLQDRMGVLLSGGEQQMLAIGRALMTNPSLLILDEATEGLAPLVRDGIWQVLHALRDAGLSILIIDKNVDALARLADRHYIIEKGRIMWSGSSAELLADEELRHRFLGV
ncbi:ABC transporter ATP-binding protein [Pusillimonas noertemannii]|uniref:Branched-chain amino acid transport system ATP-binding protein n=1 Tax=Pusillimonas noertemannii TaxID=305977 RepID=A0A2U1CH91_9BURK|nr:ABC transporter ATP-binding protein [Pusillimonas noertemannii]NYT68217.1 ABC transporter ATP-binding protein [Pusillimonas noertemannii]PVY60187.1 branched-chain amino acid transport system ATP-binding protein [Pusillimonas noertemannii]TFL10298.1 ABC transporter ATP-binding protein [Pusillimonas noertemannii]